MIELMAKNPKDRVYRGDMIVIDGYTFTNCFFTNCELMTNTGIFVFRTCVFMNCTFRYGPDAARIIRLWNLVSCLG